MKECTCEYDIFGTHESSCPEYVWKYRLPNDGSDGDALYNEVCIERDKLQAELATAKKQLLEYEQAEAAVCPEDVGVKEYVGLLKAELTTLQETNRWIPVAEGLPTVYGWIDLYNIFDNDVYSVYWADSEEQNQFVLDKLINYYRPIHQPEEKENKK